MQNQAPIPRVTFQEPISSQITTDDPPDLIEENNTIPDLSNESQNSPFHQHKHNLRERKNLLNQIIHATTTPALISDQATKSINIPSAADDMTVDDHHLPIIDEHPANTLHRWQQLQCTDSISDNKKNVSHDAPKLESANAVFDPTSGTCLEHKQLVKTSEREAWTNSFGTELGRLAQGYKKTGIKGTNTIKFIPWNKLPTDKKPTCARTCCN